MNLSTAAKYPNSRASTEEIGYTITGDLIPSVKMRLASLGRRVRASMAPAAFGFTLLVSVVAPANAATSVQPAYNACPLPSPESSPIVRLINRLESEVMNMLGLPQAGCSIRPE